MGRKQRRAVNRMRGTGRQGVSGASGLLMFFIVWTMVGLVSGGLFFKWQVDNRDRIEIATDVRAEENQVLLTYIDQGITVISRGLSGRRPPVSEDGSINVFSNMIGAAYPMIAVVDPTEAHERDDQGQGDELAAGLLSDENNPQVVESVIKELTEQQVSQPAVVASPEPVVKPKQMVLDDKKPVVIIYHTHATESYLPVTDGNFHSVDEKATVREVGSVLAAELEAAGIQVIHDKTLHDSPSYNQSYSRSLATIKQIMSKIKSPMIIIDLHRDAAGYTQNQALTTTIDGKKVAKYGFVVGTENTNVKALQILAGYMIEKSNQKYPGIARAVIEKPYKFNEYLSDYYMLLEVGNNQNHIDESVASIKCFGKVLAEAISKNFQ